MKEYLEKLNPEQREMATTIDGPIFTLAGAGAGKTAAMIARLANMIDDGIAPSSILLLTFTNKAADEMKERAKIMVGEKAEEVTALTYHSFCVRMLRQYSGYANLPNDFAVLSTSDVESAVSIVKSELQYNKIKGFPSSKLIAGWISATINTNVTFSNLMETTKYKVFIKEVSKIKEKYIEYKEKRDYLDYDDMLVFFLEAIQNNPTLCDKIANTYQYIMCDETQDENNIQTAIIGELRKKIKNICVVGDDGQSLYSWRGANVHNFLSFTKRYPDAKQITLFQNYRSSQEILDLSNNVMNVHMNEGIKKKMQGQFHGTKPEVINVDTSDDEAEFIIDKIKELKNAGLHYSDIAVLERMASQSLKLESLLSLNNIPYVKYGGIKFLERSDVVDILSYLRIIANPVDELAWFRVLQRYEGIGKNYGEKLAKLCIEKKYDLLLNNPFTTYKFSNVLKNLYSLIMEWREINIQNLVPIIIEHYIDVSKSLMITSETSAMEKQFIENDLKSQKDELSALSSIATKYTSLFEFLDSFVLDQSQEENNSDAVVISTIHSAKGLEWDTVFLLDVVDEYTPVLDFYGNASEEELRCFYVAITRPKNNLYMMHPNFIIKWGKPKKGNLSRYLQKCENYFVYKRANGRLLSA